MSHLTEIDNQKKQSFSYPDELWERIQKATNDVISVSSFIRMAVDEKLRRK